MLYITTRDNKDAFTAHRALMEASAPDGGLFVPFRLPAYHCDEIAALRDKTFGQTVAEILNVFFSAQLTGWDVDFCVGRNVSRLVTMNHRIAVSELWHNPQAKYDYIVTGLYNKIAGQNALGKEPSEWFKIAVQIAILFGLYGEILQSQIISAGELIDISLSGGDFTAPIAAWYARKMGLPVGTIICTYEEDSAVWDLIHRGAFNTASAEQKLRLGIERLIHASLGFDEVKKYLDKCQNGQSITINDEQLKTLSDGLFCSVLGNTRADSIINSVYRSNSYVIDPLTALNFGGLQDFRAKTGESRLTLLLATRSPMDYIDQIANATGISREMLIDHVNLV